MPKSDSLNKELAQEFLDFISLPENASQNMDYIGYTPFICGDDILDLVRSWYDLRSDYGLFYIDENDALINVEYSYSQYVNLKETYGDRLYVYWLNEDSESDPSVEDIIADYTSLYEAGEISSSDEGYISLSDGELELLYPEDIDEVDLSYLFNGTLTSEDDGEAIFLVYDYLYHPEDGSENVAVGRQFFCQYPDEETITRCAVMADYGPQNEVVLKMWEEVKSNALPLWAIILLVLEIMAGVGVILYFFISKKINKRYRKEHRAQA